MLLSKAPDLIMCRTFLITLKKAGLRWFTTLPSHSISYFKQIAEAFNMHFATSRALKKTSATLVNFQQGRRETLKEYLAHFNTLALEIRGLNEGIVVHQLTVGLQTGHFSLSLAKKSATSLANLLTHLEKYINA